MSEDAGRCWRRRSVLAASVLEVVVAVANAKVVDEKSIPNHVACSKTETRGRNAYAAESGFPRSLLAPGLTKQNPVRNQHILDIGRPTFFSRAFSIVFGNVVPCPPSRAVSHK